MKWTLGDRESMEIIWVGLVEFKDQNNTGKKEEILKSQRFFGNVSLVIVPSGFNKVKDARGCFLCISFLCKCLNL